MIGFYSPVAHLYYKHQRGVHDFLAYGAIYLLVYYLDVLANFNGYDLTPLTLPLFGGFYAAANYLVKSGAKADLFNMFGNHGYAYCLLMAIFSWLAYSFYLRPQMLSGN